MVSEHCPDKKNKKLRDVCRTRWLERIDGLDTFQELYVPIVYSLEAISNDRNKFGSDSQTATSLFKLITTFEFIVSLVVTRAVFDETHVVTKIITTIKNKIDSFHDKCYLDAKVIAEQIGVDECQKRTVGRQIHCDNHPAENTSEYFKRVLTIPVVDHLDLALSDRFCNDNLTLFHGLSIIPDKIISLLNGPSEKNNWRESIRIFSDFFSEDLPNPLALEAECGLWEIYWTTTNYPIPNNVSDTLKSISCIKTFANIFVCLQLLVTSPVTTCSCERSISNLCRLKTWSRSTMSGDRLNGLALMYTHRDIVPDTQEVIKKLVQRNGNRKLNLS
ncbi:52 kDa repressor of the inhibitor of the protein kinase-like isoform X2 [Hydra vulgaris]|uniref:52 kDa repressor of the inhibitor of the protein kinase-like isoform X2 n=1 Tax=Hydra vulgaris TaxID=6087 RepID=A0ABM4CTV7_HYDVU